MSRQIIYHMPNQEYHAETGHISSSGLKMMVRSPTDFYNKYVLKEKKEEKSTSLPQLLEGSYLHSRILEPHLTEQEYAIYPGLVKKGKEYEEFKENNKGKGILSRIQKERMDNIITYYEKCEVAKDLVKDCLYEVSLFTSLAGVPLKVRADAINPDKGYIIDLKTTTYDLTVEGFSTAIEYWNYDLSTSMYLECFEDYFKKPLSFFFIILGKKQMGCAVFEVSPERREKGRILFYDALEMYKTQKYLNTEKSADIISNMIEKI